MAYETVTKLRAAERQLRVAVRLFFEDRDLVAVHTLAAAAQGVLYDLGKRRGIISIFKDNPLVRPDKKKEVAKLFNEAQNFFKHANLDPDAEVKFYYGATPFYLLDATQLYIALTGRQFPEIIVLQMWFAVKFPDLLQEGPFKEQVMSHARNVDPDDHRLLLEIIDHFSDLPGLSE